MDAEIDAALPLVTAGYLFGNVPWVQRNLSKIIWAMILIPGLLVLIGAWRGRRRAEPVA